MGFANTPTNPEKPRRVRGRNSQKPDWKRRRTDPDVYVFQEVRMAVREEGVKSAINRRVGFTCKHITGYWRTTKDNLKYCVEVVPWGDPLLIYERGQWYKDADYYVDGGASELTLFVLDDCVPDAQPMSYETMLVLKEFGIAGVAVGICMQNRREYK